LAWKKAGGSKGKGSQLVILSHFDGFGFPILGGVLDDTKAINPDMRNSQSCRG
jgi:hypothetical protein